MGIRQIFSIALKYISLSTEPQCVIAVYAALAT
jgi:hypothetical protein